MTPPPITKASRIATSIRVTTSFIGVHCWPNAPSHRAYLAVPHRHKFGVSVEVSVTGHDREIEFHDLLDEVNLALPTSSVRRIDASNEFLNMSCEHHAQRMLDLLAARYPDRELVVIVDEDGECFSKVVSIPAC